MYKISIDAEEIEKLEAGGFNGEIVVVDSEGPVFDEAVRWLKRQKVIGFDTESRPSFSPDQPHYGTSLLQLSGHNKAYLFRVNKTGLPYKLRNLLATPKIIKVGG